MTCVTPPHDSPAQRQAHSCAAAACRRPVRDRAAVCEAVRRVLDEKPVKRAAAWRRSAAAAPAGRAGLFGVNPRTSYAAPSASPRSRARRAPRARRRASAPVHDRERPAVRERLVGQPGDRPDLERRADDQQQASAGRARSRGRSPSAGSSSPNMTTSGLSTAPQPAQRGGGAGSSDALAALERPHDEAARGPDRAVHLDHLTRAGALVQAVDVLRHDRPRSPRARAPRARGAPVFGRPRRAARAGARRTPRPAPDRAGRRRSTRTPSGRTRPDARSRERKSGMPVSVETPAPVSVTMGRCPRSARQAIAGPRVRTWRTSASRPTLRVRFAETDAQGVAHHATYLVWFEVARVDYLERFVGGYQRLRDAGLEVLMLEAHLRDPRRPRSTTGSASTRASATCEARASATSTRSSARGERDRRRLDAACDASTRRRSGRRASRRG